MKLYLGNSQDIELNLDEEAIIHIYPIASARGSVSHQKTRSAYLTKYCDGIVHGMKYFYYKPPNPKSYRSLNRDESYKIKGDAEASAHKYYEEHNKNTINSIIPIKAKDIDSRIIKHF